ncbi:MAG: dTDP-4-dehydrorhamnose reductase [Chloroflexia bacterium]|nr:dTDP-4-dehydrorhamnose reductase [Chloroflexia bacterium]
MRIAIIGHQGQLGRALQRALADHELLGLDLPEYDITVPEPLQQALRVFGPQVVIQTAAYTHVDGCARDPGRALRVNGLGTQNVALACQTLDAALLYVSTNEVFAGDQEEPYLEYDPPRPINPYGYSKWVGERFVEQLCRRFYIVRPSWLFGGPSSFVSKILALAQERDELAVVDDEFGAPTYAPDLAEAITGLIASHRYGIYHLVNEGWCSRYDLAVAALELAGREVPVRRIQLADYERSSTPPPRALLHNFCAAEALGIRLRPWQEALAACLQQE